MFVANVVTDAGTWKPEEERHIGLTDEEIKALEEAKQAAAAKETRTQDDKERQRRKAIAEHGSST